MKLFLSFVIILLTLDVNAFINKSIYGNDNRRLVRDLNSNNSKDQFFLNYSASIMAQIPSWRISNQSKEYIEIETKTLKTGLKFCSDEKYIDEPIVSSCSAFLVAPNMILTAGHCIKDKYDCKKNTWVLDYLNTNDNSFIDGKIRFLKEKTFQCAELISHIENSKIDYALIKLDHSVSDRTILHIRKNGKTDSKEPLFLLGHPLGMPMIVSDEIFIRDNSLDYFFKTNADSFSGNSGSPLIGLNSGLVEGILIRGDDDYSLDEKANCYRNVKCNDNDCRGESALRSSYLPIKFLP